MRKTFLLAALLFFTGYSWANIVINGTRIIYLDENKDIIVQLINDGDSPALVQSWIDDGDINSTPETANVPFLLSPPVVKISPYNGQQLRIKKVTANIPNDRESVFFLNVLDIPPIPKYLQKQNTMQLAVKSRIKLFYRPVALKGSLDNAVNKVKLIAENKGFRIVNDGPFHITIANIENQVKTKLLAESLMISPFSQHFTLTKNSVKTGLSYQIMYIDDSGAYKTRTMISQ